MKIRTTSLAFVFAVIVWGCSDLLMDAPLEYPDGVRYFEDPEFFRWWGELKTCSKLSGDLDQIVFFHVPVKTLASSLHGIRTLGQYFPETQRIFVIDDERTNPAVIRHEMMHALLKDESGHPPKYFGYDGLCGYL